MEESVQGQGTPISEREALIARIKARQQQVMSSGLSKKVLGTDKKLRSAIERTELKNKAAEKFGSYLDSLTLSKPSGLVADDNETTRQFRTANLKSEMSMQMRSQIWDVKLDFGEYRCDFGQDGKTLALAGSKGHVALLDWKQKRLMKEWRLTERTRDIKVVAQNRMVAVAQKDFVSVYDEQGLEVHRLRNMPEPQWLEYLPYHFLLCSISSFGLLSYQDLTTGQIVAEHKTKVREATFLRQNPHNGIIFTGNDRGVVKMWAPNTGIALASMFCHSTHILDCGVTRDGNYMTTVGADSKMNIFDLRTHQLLHSYFTPLPASRVSVSQRGLVSLACRDQVITWRDCFLEKQKAPYLKQEATERRKIIDLAYIPYEDMLGVGELGGFETMAVPGAGEANYDAFESGIGLSKIGKSNMLVRSMVEKLPAATITIDPSELYTYQPEKEQTESPATQLVSASGQQGKKKNRTRGRDPVNKASLMRQTLKDRQRQEKIRLDNVARLKAKMAEKVKQMKEGSVVQSLETEVVERLPNMVQQKLERILAKEKGSSNGISQNGGKKPYSER